MISVTYMYMYMYQYTNKHKTYKLAIISIKRSMCIIVAIRHVWDTLQNITKHMWGVISKPYMGHAIYPNAGHYNLTLSTPYMYM